MCWHLSQLGHKIVADSGDTGAGFSCSEPMWQHSGCRYPDADERASTAAINTRNSRKVYLLHCSRIYRESATRRWVHLVYSRDRASITCVLCSRSSSTIILLYPVSINDQRKTRIYTERWLLYLYLLYLYEHCFSESMNTDTCLCIICLVITYTDRTKSIYISVQKCGKIHGTFIFVQQVK